jgi:archaellum component FlaC
MEPEIITFLKDYGILGFLAYIFIKDFFAYLNKNKIADTLKEANDDRKPGTDEVARELNNNQDINLGRIDERLKVIECNHLVHIQAALDANAKDHSEIKVAIAKMEGKIDMLLKQ